MKKLVLNFYMEHSKRYTMLYVMLGIMEFLNTPLKILFLIIPIGIYALGVRLKEYLHVPFIPDELIHEYNIFINVLLLLMLISLTLAVIATVGRTLYEKETKFFREAFEENKGNEESIHLIYKRKKGKKIERRIYSYIIPEEWNNKSVYLRVLKIFDEHFETDKFITDTCNSRVTIMKTESGFTRPMREEYHDEILDKEMEEIR
ncbi:MAG: hypothetical protein EGQ79_08560 [Ruminococcus sp.]|nr:hypothetical protein [Ruminococcus sp.]